ncbi:hypothetical protein D3C78_831420 [compost metagenome]
MVRTINDGSFNVYKREACKYAVFHLFFDTRKCRSDVLSRNRATDNFTFEFATSTWLEGFKFNPHVTVLTTTTRLAYKFTFDASRCLERFAVSNLWFTHIGFYFELTTHTVDDDVQVKFTHTSQDSLACFFISMSTKSWILFSQLTESNAQFILVSFCFWFNSDFDNWIREVH